MKMKAVQSQMRGNVRSQDTKREYTLDKFFNVSDKFSSLSPESQRNFKEYIGRSSQPEAGSNEDTSALQSRISQGRISNSLQQNQY